MQLYDLYQVLVLKKQVPVEVRVQSQLASASSVGLLSDIFEFTISSKW